MEKTLWVVGSLNPEPFFSILALGILYIRNLQPSYTTLFIEVIVIAPELQTFSAIVYCKHAFCHNKIVKYLSFNATLCIDNTICMRA